MLTKLMKMLLISFGIAFIYKNRYKALNWLLGNRMIRKYAVQFAMNIPGVKKVFMQSAFR